MSGCYGNSQEDRAREAELNRHLDNTYGKPEARKEEIELLAKDKFMALPDLYACRDGTRRWTNIEDASASLNQSEWIAIGRCLRDGKYELAGICLKNAMMRVMEQEAENEIDDRS